MLRLMQARRLFALLAGSLSVLVAVLSPGSHASGRAVFASRGASCSWQPISSPVVTGGRLSAVAADSPSDAWAVGEAGPWQGGDDWPAKPAPLVAHWDGNAWSSVPANLPRGSLDGVAIVSPSDVWAVGTYPGASSDNWPAAYNTYGRDSLIEHWDGRSWKRVASPRGEPLKAVAAAGPRDVWAVGSVYDDGTGKGSGWILHWNGGKWKRVLATSKLLRDITVVSPTDVWAVGDVAMHWNGRVWTVLPLPRKVGASSGPPSLAAVSARSASDAWVAGIADLGPGDGSTFGGQTVLLHWTGRRWINRSPALRDSRAALSSLVLQPSGDVWLTGVDEDSWVLGPGGGASIVHARVDSRAWRDAWAQNAAFQRIEQLAPESATTLWAVGYQGVGDAGPMLPSGGYPAYSHTEPVILHYSC